MHLYELGTVIDLAVSFQNLNLSECPLDLTLQVECDGVPCFESQLPYLDIFYIKDGFYTLEVYSNDKAVIGQHMVKVSAIDTLRGFKTATKELDLQIIPQCSLERIKYDESVETSVRLRDPSQVIVVNPGFLPGKYPDCPVSLIEVEVKGPDAAQFLDKVSSSGVVTIADLKPGTYNFELEASLGSNLI